MARLSPEPRLEPGKAGKTAVLLVNLGTPEAPTAEAVRPYLDEFLSDPRVVEIPRLVWWPILHLFVLTRRPKASAERYAAFLELAPSLIAREARTLHGGTLERALDAYAKARELAAIAPRLSLDPAATVFQIGGILADVADPASLKR